MGAVVTQETSEDAITQEEIDKALEAVYNFFSHFSDSKKDEKKILRKIADDGHHLTLQSSPVKDSTLDQIRRGEPFKIKTVFHSVDVDIEDMFGGRFSCTYEIKPTIERIADFLKTIFPKLSEKQIAEVAKESGETYEEAKSKLIFVFAEKIFFGRMAIGKFFHSELEKTLKIAIADLVSDVKIWILIFSTAAQSSNGMSMKQAQILSKT